MKKSDLKNGMVVELRNGKRFLIVNDLGIGKDSCINLDGFFGYDENLNDVCGNSTLDITKIYKTEGTTFKTLFDNERLNLIWERKEQPKLSEKDKKKIKIALKKVKEICSNYKDCKKDCEFNVDGLCIFADDPSDFELDNLFKD